MTGVPDRVGLLRLLARARAFEGALASAREAPPPSGDAHAPRAGPPAIRPVSPAAPAVWALDRRDDGAGDVFSLRSGSAGAALAFGTSPETLLRQALGRSTAPAEGRDPGAFPTDLARGLLAPFPLPGTLVEVLAGVALAFRLRGERRVALLVDDTDGSASGFWHEGLNLAAVRRAPLVLVVDASRRRPTTARIDRLSVRARAYGIEARTVASGDPLDVHETVREAVEGARGGGGTWMVEVTGRTDDAFETLAGRLAWSGDLDEGLAEKLDAEARTEMGSVLERVLVEPPPSADAVRSPVASGMARPATPFVPPRSRAG